MFDPSKMTPQTIAEISELMSMLSPEQIMKMQSLMHNQMGGFNVTKEMQEFENSLPPNFREKMARIMYLANGIAVPPPQASSVPTSPAAAVETSAPEPTNATEARLVILRSVQSGMMTPEEALNVLFN